MAVVAAGWGGRRNSVEYVIGGVAIAFVVFLAFGAITGRVRSRSCCATPDPSRDLRMRAAYEGDESPSAR
jgi:hypothetical protein